MKPQEKAKELVDKMKSKLYSDGLYDAKQCALIAVDEILLNFESSDAQTDFYNEVKQEIEKL